MSFVPVAGVVAGVALMAPPGTADALPQPVERCRVLDARLNELSGIASDGESWYAVSDGGDSVSVFVLDPEDCSVRDVRTSPVDPSDIEDLALAEDGALWLADTGDNGRDRDTVALHVLPADGGSSLYRLTYPDGPHDAEAILLDRFGKPFIVTKEPFGQAQIYTPADPLDAARPVALRWVAALPLSSTDSDGGPFPGTLGSVLVTGGAVSHDGNVIAVRTYTEAYLYHSPNGNVAKALRGTPLRVPLPNEPQGEAIGWEPGGTLLSASEGFQQPIRAVQGAASAATAYAQPPADQGSQENPRTSDIRSEKAAESEQRALSAVPALLVAGCLAALILFGIGKLRRRSE